MRRVVLDASGLIALLLDEPAADWVIAQLATEATRRRMSWINVTEVALAAERKAIGGAATAISALEQLRIEFLQPDRDIAVLVAEARQKFPLNYGDCFAYAHAKLLGEPLLTLDADFLKTDFAAVLHPDA